MLRKKKKNCARWTKFFFFFFFLHNNTPSCDVSIGDSCVCMYVCTYTYTLSSGRKRRVSISHVKVDFYIERGRCVVQNADTVILVNGLVNRLVPKSDLSSNKRDRLTGLREGHPDVYIYRGFARGQTIILWLYILCFTEKCT